MRSMATAVTACILLFLAGCSIYSVRTDYDRSIGFTSWKTYRWYSPPARDGEQDLFVSNPFLAKRVRQSVDRELAARGYVQKTTGPADFTVAASGTIREGVAIDVPPPPASYSVGAYHGRAYWYRDAWGFGYPDLYPYAYYYDDETIIIDCIDAASGSVAWRGVVRSDVTGSRTPEEMDAHVAKAVSKLFEKFPPGSAK